MSGLLAALWLVGLFVAAPALRTGQAYDATDRLRDGLILGVAIPFGLGFVHLLYPAACWAVLAAVVAIAYLRRATAEQQRAEPTPYLLLGAVAAVAWPQLIRPLLDGDSLSYHLPNAAAFAQAHSLWTIATHYWWYPPASELFAAGLYAVGSPFALPWSGVGALALVGFRIASWSRRLTDAPPMLSDALAAATVTALPLALQGATLQNDVWLAAFWLETLYWLATQPGTVTLLRTASVTALIKPQGFLFALIVLAAFRARWRLWLATGAVFAVWFVHDAILWRPGASGMLVGAIPWQSTILAHGATALGVFIRVAFIASPFGLLAFVAALFGPLIERTRPAFGWASFAAAGLFFVLPFGYATAVAQLSTGASLRFAAPAIAAGAVILARPASRVAGLATIVLSASALFGIAAVLQIFWNDGSTHLALPIAALAIGIAALGNYRRLRWLYAISGVLSVALATHLAARHPLDYYADALRTGGRAPGIYRWIATARPAAIGGWGMRLGIVNVVSPSTRTVDVRDASPCLDARHDGVLLAAVAQADRATSENARRLDAARHCGEVLYSDPAGVVVKPFQTAP